MMGKLKQKLIVIVGPTASGKSELAVKIAKKYSGEIISADSRQVYRGLDAGTGKVPGKWHKGVFIYKTIPHYCIDFVNPKKTFSAADFAVCAKKAVREIAHTGKIPILVGGTGFWIDALIYHAPFPEVVPDQKLRAHLARKTPAKLLTILQRLDPRRAKTIEQKNPRRLIRAIEIARALGRIPDWRKQSFYDVLWLGLNPSSATLKKRIETRTNQIIKRGLIPEIRQLRAQHLNKKRIQEFGFTYRVALDYDEGNLTRSELSRRMARATIQYAKRQMTWLKRNSSIIWNPSADDMKKLMPRAWNQRDTNLPH